MMKTNKLTLIILLLLLTTVPVFGQVRHVILISIDGFHPDMYLDKSWPSPNMQQMLKRGTYADHLLSVFPSYTYPSHTAMITGAFPARSGIYYNQPLNSRGDWNWFMEDIKVPTLWQVLKDKGMTTAAVCWPVAASRKHNSPITWGFADIWDNEHPEDRITEARKYTTPSAAFVTELEENATGKLDTNAMREDNLSMDEQTARIASYIFKSKLPSFMAVHLTECDSKEHDDGRDADSVRLALAEDDHAIGDILETVQRSKAKDSTAVIIVGDHGFATIRQIFRPNMLLRSLPVRFLPAGGSAFLYRLHGSKAEDEAKYGQQVTDSLNTLPKDKRKLFHMIYRKELDQMGADSDVLMALTSLNGTGLVYSGSTKARQSENHGPGTLIQNNKLEGLFIPTTGGHHGFDPNNPEMYTGFIAWGAGINKGGHITSLREVDIAPLIAKLLGIDFRVPDGKIVPGITTF